MKKILSFSLAGMMLASTLLAGCSTTAKTESTEANKEVAESTTSGTSSENTVIKLLVPGYDGGYLKEQLDNGIAGFEKENEGVKVEIVSVGWDELNSKIVSLYQAGDAPDIMLTGSRTLTQLADLGVAADLDAYITDDFKEKRVESVLNTGKVNGKQYGIPMAFSSRALYYRSDLIDKAPTTWDELFNTAKEVKTKN